MPCKDDTFVLDFRNDADDIRDAFQQYYEATTTVPTDVNVLSDAYDRVIKFGVAVESDVETVVDTHFVGTRLWASLGRFMRFRPVI